MPKGTINWELRLLRQDNGSIVITCADCLRPLNLVFVPEVRFLLTIEELAEVVHGHIGEWHPNG